MAILVTHIKISGDNSGTGANVPMAHIKTYEELDEPAYSGGSQVGDGDIRYIIRFHMINPYDKNHIDWVFTSAADRTEELTVIDAAVAQLLSSTTV